MNAWSRTVAEIDRVGGGSSRIERSVEPGADLGAIERAVALARGPVA